MLGSRQALAGNTSTLSSQSNRRGITFSCVKILNQTHCGFILFLLQFVTLYGTDWHNITKQPTIKAKPNKKSNKQGRGR